MEQRCLGIAVALLICVSCGTAVADQFVLSEDDLPEAVVGEYRVAFSRNGAITIAREGKWLFDAGVGYMVSGWSEWGTQIRRSSPTDGWSVEGNGDALVFKGTMFDTKNTPRFTFSQRVGLINAGLRVHCTLTPNDKRPIEAAGLVAHCPVELHGGGAIEFLPGLSRVELPKLEGTSLIGTSKGRMAAISSDGPVASMLGRSSLQWQLFDDRAWNLNTFRVLGWDESLAKKLSLGESAEFEYEILLGDNARERVDVGDMKCALGPVGWTTVFVAGQARLRGGPARFTEHGLEFLTGAIGTSAGETAADAAVFDVACSKDDTEAILTYRWTGKEVPAESGECRVLLAARLPTGATVTDGESGNAVTPGASPTTAGNSLVLSWKEGAKVARAQDGSYTATWERNPTIRLSSDRPWKVAKEKDWLFLSVGIEEADGKTKSVPIRLRPTN